MTLAPSRAYTRAISATTPRLAPVMITICEFSYISSWRTCICPHWHSSSKEWLRLATSHILTTMNCEEHFDAGFDLQDSINHQNLARASLWWAIPDTLAVHWCHSGRAAHNGRSEQFWLHVPVAHCTLFFNCPDIEAPYAGMTPIRFVGFDLSFGWRNTPSASLINMVKKIH